MFNTTALLGLSVGISCPEGTFNNGTGLSTQYQCINCTAGYICNSTGLVNPEYPCPAGEFLIDVEVHSCLKNILFASFSDVLKANKNL